MNLYKKCCFIGHRKIEITNELEKALYDYIEYLIVNENVKIFLFGSKSQFDDLCYDIVTNLKEKYEGIKRIYVRSNYEFVDETYKNYLLKYFEDTIYPNACKGAGKLSYVKRNQAMICESDFCVFYYNKNYVPPKKVHNKRYINFITPTSGTALAFKYAKIKNKSIKNFFEQNI